MADVVLEKVCKSFGFVTAVNEIYLEIPDHQFTVLLGPSGCGKTTCLRMIAGLEEPTSGRILIGGRDMTFVPPRDRDIAMVFQTYALYPHMSVRENLGIGLKFRKKPKAEIGERIDKAAKLLGIENFLDRRPGQLSGGQRQRVALGRAIVRNPQVFLMDEPLSNLDTKLRAQMRIELKCLHQELQTTTVYVTHDQLEAMTMSDRIAVMNEGRLHQVDFPDRVFNEPVDRLVAQVVGSPSMNFFPGVLESKGGTLFLRAEGFCLPVKDNRAHALVRNRTGQEVEVGIRPQAVKLTPNTTGSITVGEVFVLEPGGTQTHVHIKLGSQSLVAVADSSFSARIHEPIGIRLQSRDVYLFDAISGKALLHGL